jgi:hypothetical protein
MLRPSGTPFHHELTRQIRFERIRASLPDFERLLAECPDDASPQSRSQATQDNAVAVFQTFEGACKELGFRLLLLELSILQVPDLLNSRQQPFFATYTYCICDDSRSSILTAYREAMKFMTKPESGNDPIIPHPKLYEDYLSICEVVDVGNCAQTFTVAPENPYNASSFSVFPFPYTQGKGEKSVVVQIHTFVQAFVKHLPPNALSLVAGRLIMVVPFQRPAYRVLAHSDSVSSSEDRREAVPGGALFLLVEPTTEMDSPLTEELRIRKCVHELSLMLYTAALAGSYTRLEYNLTKSILLGGMIHGTLNAIRAADPAGLKLTLLGPDRTLKSGIETDAETARVIVDAVHRVSIAVDTAGAMIALAEIGSHNFSVGERRLPSKFGSIRTISVAEILEPRLLEMLVNSQVESDDANKSGWAHLVDLSVEGADHWVLPATYLDDRVIRGILLEFVKNCSRHGHPTSSDGKMVHVEVRVYAVGKKAIEVSVACQVPPREWVDAVGAADIKVRADQNDFGRLSFLVRLKHLTMALRGLDVRSEIEEKASGPCYVTYLTLGEMISVDHAGKEKLIAPESR